MLELNGKKNGQLNQASSISRSIYNRAYFYANNLYGFDVRCDRQE